MIACLFVCLFVWKSSMVLTLERFRVGIVSTLERSRDGMVVTLVRC